MNWTVQRHGSETMIWVEVEGRVYVQVMSKERGIGVAVAHREKLGSIGALGPVYNYRGGFRNVIDENPTFTL